VEAKKAGNSSAPHGLRSASTPPANAANSPMSTSAALVPEGGFDGVDEHGGGLCPHDRLTGEDERGCGVRSDIHALLLVALDLLQRFGSAQIASETLDVEADVIGRL